MVGSVPPRPSRPAVAPASAFLGVFFGVAVGSGATHLERLRIARGIGAALVAFGCLGALYGTGAWIAPTLREQGSVLRQRVPEAVDRIQTWVHHRPGVAGVLLGGQAVTQARTLGERFVRMLHARDPNDLGPWLAAAQATDLRRFAAGIQRDRDAVLAARCFR